jgi:hypothetical protein
MDEPRGSDYLPLLELAFCLVIGAVACARLLIDGWPLQLTSLPAMLLLAGLILTSLPLARMALGGFVVWLTRDRPEPLQTIPSQSPPLWDRELDESAVATRPYRFRLRTLLLAVAAAGITAGNLLNLLSLGYEALVMFAPVLIGIVPPVILLVRAHRSADEPDPPPP